MRRDLLPMVQEALEGQFHVEREIARGGAARVFRATRDDGTVVALKVLRPELSVTVTADRFLREIEVLRQFDHPHIAKLLASGETRYLIYYVMDYVDGPTLRSHLDQVKQASVNDVLHIGYDLLDALRHAHELGIIHRDVKPENIVLAEHGPMLVDFGIARAVAESASDKLTRSGFAVGTSSYMSPEQVRGDRDIDHRSDIYSLGCVLFECLCARPPFVSKQSDLVLRMHLEMDAPPVRSLRADVPEGLAKVIDKALLTDTDRRWQTAKEMRQAIGELG